MRNENMSSGVAERLKVCTCAQRVSGYRGWWRYISMSPCEEGQLWVMELYEPDDSLTVWPLTSDSSSPWLFHPLRSVFRDFHWLCWRSFKPLIQHFPTWYLNNMTHQSFCVALRKEQLCHLNFVIKFRKYKVEDCSSAPANTAVCTCGKIPAIGWRGYLVRGLEALVLLRRVGELLECTNVDYFMWTLPRMFESAVMLITVCTLWPVLALKPLQDLLSALCTRCTSGTVTVNGWMHYNSVESSWCWNKRTLVWV